MTDIEEKLKLESTLNQIYSNDNLYDGSIINFIFYNVNYIYLNDVYLYSHNIIEIIMDNDCMSMKIDSTLMEITYSDINDFLINIREGKDV